MATSMVGNMHSRCDYTPLLLIAMLCLVPFTFVSANTSESDNKSLDFDKGQIAYWDSTTPAGSYQFDLQHSTGLIHSRLGSFDPLNYHKLPAPEELQFHRVEVDRIAIIQLYVNDFQIVENICIANGCTILETIPDSSWRIRLPKNSIDSLFHISQNEQVRWIGPEIAALRLHESLVYSWESLPKELDLVALPAPDISDSEMSSLVNDLSLLNVKEVTCDIAMCRVLGMTAANDFGQRIQLKTMLNDGRLLFIEPLVPLRVLNAQASIDVGLTSIISAQNSGLDGSGETFAVLDTGLDSDHPDFGNRVLSVRVSCSYDQSGADSNSGHGTHVTGTLISDGGSFNGGKGLTPQATIHMYALEYDLSGQIAKTCSTYDILRDSSIAGARIGVNAWGSTVDLGQYNLESRSIDTFARDYPDFLAVFAVGDDPIQGSSSIVPPSTAKNVLAIGASDGTVVANFSAQGPSLDGRVKPDLVAPGVGICSTRAEEASIPIGQACGTGTHSSGNSLYMSISGTSPATAVGGASAGLMRQFLRTEAGLSGTVTSDLVKAALINGAKDLGVANIPNAGEGWGQIDLENSMYPVDGATPLNTWYDNEQELGAGFGFIYTFDIDSSHGLDITLAWIDQEGSSVGSQSSSRLVNDLDIKLIAPDGTIWLGNDFASGQSTTGGTKDSTNNVERIRINSGVQTQTGQWSVMISNQGGSSQGYALVVTANGSITPSTDLATYSESIITSQENPLVDDVITIQVSWINQAPLDSGQYRIIFEDITSGEKLLDTNHSNLEGGEIYAQSIYHTFTSTGQHELRLTIDSDSEVVEINDENNGINNNIHNLSVNVSAIGLRLIPMMSDGNEPSTPEEISNAAIHELDAGNETEIDVPFKLRNEGTSEEVIEISVTNVQEYYSSNPNRLFSPKDNWARTLVQGDEFTLPAAGEVGDSELLTLNLEDTSADLLSDPSRWARAGSFVIDITARYQTQPLVSFTLRIYVNVESVEAVQVVAAGIGNLQAEPGEVSTFSISVRNTGNTIDQPSMTCTSEHGWPIELGTTQSSTINFEPLDILEYLPMQVKLWVPPVTDGAPAAGETEMVTCVVTSSNDPTFAHTEYANVTVAELKDFTTDLFDRSGNPVGPQSTAMPIMVDTGETVNMTMTVTNSGNTEIPISVNLQSANSAWGMYLVYEGEIENDKATFDLPAGSSVTIQITAVIPLSTTDGSQNAFSLTTRLDEVGTNQYITNGTDLKVGKMLGLTLESSGEAVPATVGLWSSYSLWINNTGNSGLILNWTHSEPPAEWKIGFDSAPNSIEKLESTEVAFAVFAPNGTQVGDINSTILVRVIGTYYNSTVEAQIDLQLEVVPTLHFGVEISDDSNFQDIPRGQDGSIGIMVTNLGNSPGGGAVTARIVDGDGIIDDDWVLEYEEAIPQLSPGEIHEFTIFVMPKDTAGTGLRTVEVTIVGQADSGIIVTTTEDMSIGVTAEVSQSSFDLYSLVPFEAFIAIIVILPIIAVVGIRRLRSKAKTYLDDAETLVSPGVHTTQDNVGDRRAEALMEDVENNEDLISGGISDGEIQAALIQSIGGLPPPGPTPIPSGLPPVPGELPEGLPPLDLPPVQKPAVAPPQAAFEPAESTSPNISPPLPPEGLPAGWTMEQWKHYGAEWLLRQGRS